MSAPANGPGAVERGEIAHHLPRFGLQLPLSETGRLNALCGGGCAGVPQAYKREKGIWQRRFWEHQIRDEHDLAQHIQYIHFNPVKHGLVQRVEDWPYSSYHRLRRETAGGHLLPTQATQTSLLIIQYRTPTPAIEPLRILTVVTATTAWAQSAHPLLGLTVAVGLLGRRRLARRA